MKRFHAALAIGGLAVAIAMAVSSCQRQEPADATLPPTSEGRNAMTASPFEDAHERLAGLPPDDSLSSLRGAASLARLQDQVVAGDYALVPSLAGLAGHERPAIRAAAIDLLGQLVAAAGSPGLVGSGTAAQIEGNVARASDSILRGLDDEDEGVRLAAVNATGGLPDADALEALRSRLEDPSAAVRFQALHALHERGRAAGDAPGLHDDPDERVRELARLIAP